MVGEQDSHGTTRILTPRQRVEAEIDRRVDLKLVGIERKVDRLSAQGKTLEIENAVLRKEVADLRAKYNAIQHRVRIVDRANSTGKYDDYVMEQIDIQAEIIGAFVDLFVPLYKWLTKIMQKRSKLGSNSPSNRLGRK